MGARDCYVGDEALVSRRARKQTDFVRPKRNDFLHQDSKVDSYSETTDGAWHLHQLQRSRETFASHVLQRAAGGP